MTELDRTHDMVIVSFHGGAEGADRTHVTREPEEFYGERRGNVYEFAHAAVDAGADVVIGHGPHVPRAVEIYRDRFIAYSLGNFWTWARFNLRGPNGLAPVLDLEVDRDGRAVRARIVSARQTGLGSPRLDPEARAARLIGDLTREDFPEAGLEFAADGRITWDVARGGHEPRRRGPDDPTRNPVPLRHARTPPTPRRPSSARIRLPSWSSASISRSPVLHVDPHHLLKRTAHVAQVAQSELHAYIVRHLGQLLGLRKLSSTLKLPVVRDPGVRPEHLAVVLDEAEETEGLVGDAGSALQHPERIFVIGLDARNAGQATSPVSTQ